MLYTRRTFLRMLVFCTDTEITMGYPNLAPHTAVDPVLEQSISAALLAFQPYSQAISVNHIRETVLLNYPDCDLPAVLLSTHIVDLAIRGGFNIHFDGERDLSRKLPSELITESKKYPGTKK